MVYNKTLITSVKEAFFDKNGYPLKRLFLSNIYETTWKQIEKETNILNINTSRIARLYCLVNEIYEVPKCPICNKDVSFAYTYNRGFNKTCSRECGHFLRAKFQKPHSEKTRELLQKLGKERLSKPENNPMYGKKHSEETKKKISENHKGRRMHPNTREAIKKSHIGAKRSKEACENIRRGVTTKEKLQKEYITKSKNNTWNSSKIEDEVYVIIKDTYPNVLRQYRSEEYPYSCDYYIPELKMYIELNAHWSHGEHEFNKDNENDNKILDLWKEKSKESIYYKCAVKTWEEKDKKKISVLKENNLLYCIIYKKDITKFINFIQVINRELKYSVTKDEAIQSIKRYFKNEMVGKHSFIYYFHPHFFNKENELWKDDSIKNKILKNRIKYLKKSLLDISTNEILRGFKISGIHYGYSHFNPQYIRDFIKEYNIETLYDPCGGWGHRLLGAYGINYIYNDIDINTYNGVKNIYETCNEVKIDTNKKLFYNYDASLFTPIENYDAIFTCPPYYKKELYSNKSSEQIYDSYEDWINKWFRNMIHYSIKDSVKYIGIVIDKKMELDVCKLYKEKGYTIDRRIEAYNKKLHFLKKQSSEIILYFKKS
jgi:hypothetical protein